jgi:hypothetical protein
MDWEMPRKTFRDPKIPTASKTAATINSVIVTPLLLPME